VKRPLTRIARLVALGVAAAAPTAAQAHLVATGMGPVYDGVSHFGLSPEDFLPVIGLGLFAGLRGPLKARATLAALTLGWAAGGALALVATWMPAIAAPAATALLYLAIGALLAANKNTPVALCIGVGVALGLVRGAADFLGVAASLDHSLSLLGMCAGVFAVFALAASVTLPMQRLWMIVAARVGGSWLAALGLLFAGWLLRYGAAVQ
jgi:hypothetical protein